MMTIHSDSNKIIFTSILSGLAGFILVSLTYSHINESMNVQCGFWLGILLLVIAVANLIMQEEISITLDPEQQILRIGLKNRFSNNTRIMRFSEVDHVGVETTGDNEGGSKVYHIIIYSKHGKTLSTGKWSLNQDEQIKLAEEMAELIGCHVQADKEKRLYPINIKKLLTAFVSAVIIYILWYALNVGQVCSAMWFGTAPPVIILVTFLIILTLLRLFK